MTKALKLRRRDVAHLWADKRVVRLFRKWYREGIITKADAKNLTSVYLALCQIDSDFAETRNEDGVVPIKGIVSTCASYSLIGRRTIVSKCLQTLRDMGLVDYGQVKDEETGEWRNSYLFLWMFEENGLEKYKSALIRSVHLSTTATRSLHLSQSANVPHKNNTKVLTSSKKKKKTTSSISRSYRSSPEKRLHFVFKDNGLPKKSFALDKWLDNHVLRYKADRPILDKATRLFRKKVKPASVAIREVLDYWNGFVEKGKLKGYRVSSHKLNSSKVMYKLQILITDLVQSGIKSEEIIVAIDNLDDLLYRSPHYGNWDIDLVAFLTTPQMNPGELFDNCLTGKYINSQKYFPNEYKLSLADFVKKCRADEIRAKGYIEDDEMAYIFNETAPNRYFAYLVGKGGDEEEIRAFVKKEFKKLKAIRDNTKEWELSETR